MFITGNVALAYVGLTLLDARLYQVSAKHSLETQIRDGKTAQGNPVQASGQERDVLGRIDIPRLGVSGAVLQGTGSRMLRLGAGHIEATPLRFQGSPGTAESQGTTTLSFGS